MSVFEDNRELLERFRAGEREALAEVYRRYVDEVAVLVHRGVLLPSGRRVPGAGGAETERELVQETFARAFAPKARTAYDGLRLYRPYLLRIASNLLADRWRHDARSAGREVVPADIEELERLAAEGTLEPVDPEEDAEWHRLREATRTYIAGLAPELQQFVRMRFEEERSQHELARSLGMTRWKVRVLERKVQAGLKRYLKRQGLHQ